MLIRSVFSRYYALCFCPARHHPAVGRIISRNPHLYLPHRIVKKCATVLVQSHSRRVLQWIAHPVENRRLTLVVIYQNLRLHRRFPGYEEIWVILMSLIPMAVEFMIQMVIRWPTILVGLPEVATKWVELALGLHRDPEQLARGVMNDKI